MPAFGLGTWPTAGADCTLAVHQALELGYGHIDSATTYNNEAAVGQARLVPQAMRQSLEDSPNNCQPGGAGRTAG